MALTVGIDLGTSYTRVGAWMNGRIEIFKSRYGNKHVPSCVAFSSTDRLVGELAVKYLSKNCKNCIINAKRLIGKRFDDPRLQNQIRNWPFTVVNESSNPKVQFKFKGKHKNLSPEQVAAMVIDEMRSIVQSRAKRGVVNVILTVPTHFNETQREATRDAGIIAGVNVLGVVNDTSAAALAYAHARKFDDEKTVLVFDFGGGHLDVSVVAITKLSLINVLASAGGGHLGGHDFDNRLVEYLADRFRVQTGQDIREDKRGMPKLREVAEKCKQDLSDRDRLRIRIDHLTKGDPFCVEVTRQKFEEVCHDLYESVLPLVAKVLAEAGTSKSSIDDIIMVGGSSNMPKIRSMIRDFFDGREPTVPVNADEAVVYGAAMQAVILGGVTESPGAGIDFNDVVAEAASSSLRLQTDAGLHFVIVHKNSRLPKRLAHEFTTFSDNQASLTFQVFEGEQAALRANRLLGTYAVVGIDRAPCGVPRIEVTLFVDISGILHVKAEQLGPPDKRLDVQFKNGRPSESKLTTMMFDLSKLKDDYAARREAVAARNNLLEYLNTVKAAIVGCDHNKLRPFPRKMLKSHHTRTISWVNKHQAEDKEDFNRVLNALKDKISPFMNSWKGKCSLCTLAERLK